MSPQSRLSQAEISLLVNRAMAYFEAFKGLYFTHIRSYNEPKVIVVHPEFSADPDEKAVIIVREGYGAVGIKHNWSQEQLSKGKIPFRIGRFYPEEIQLMEHDPTMCLLPSRPLVVT